jgi:hypothetical protein
MAAFLQNADAPARGCASRADYFSRGRKSAPDAPARETKKRFFKNAQCADLKNSEGRLQAFSKKIFSGHKKTPPNRGR